VIAGERHTTTLDADVCVVGGGVAGAAAALAARASGKDVVLVSRAPGATALWSGTLDVACSPDPAGRMSTTDAARSIARDFPHHPYAKLGVDALAEAIDAFDPTRFGMEGPGLDSRPLVVATELGALKPAPFAARAIAQGDLRDGGTVAVAGLAGYPRFDARACAGSLSAFGRNLGLSFTARAIDVALPSRSGRDPSSAEISRSLDGGEAMLERFASAIRASASAEGASRVLLPPVLADDRAARVASLADLPCGELCADSASLFGLRLWERIRDVLTANGVRTVAGAASGFAHDGGFVRALRLGTEGRVSANAFVLATGKFIGGGVRRDDRLRETLFDLPIFWHDTVVAYVDVLKLSAPQPWNEQRLFACGVQADARLRPLRGDRRPAFENLFAAGSVLSGYDADAEGSGFGVAILTGHSAGRFAAGGAP
jgi:glycerol-3-phosphate dehydrogenase subunit B